MQKESWYHGRVEGSPNPWHSECLNARIHMTSWGASNQSHACFQWWSWIWRCSTQTTKTSSMSINCSNSHNGWLRKSKVLRCLCAQTCGNIPDTFHIVSRPDFGEWQITKTRGLKKTFIPVMLLGIKIPLANHCALAADATATKVSGPMHQVLS